MKKRYIALILLVISGLAVTAFIIYVSTKEARRNKQIEDEIDALRQEAEKIRSNNQALQEKISYFQTPEFQEKIAKEKLNLQKPEEKVVIVKPSPSIENNNDAVSPAQAGENKKEIPNYLKWFNLFFK